MPDLKILSWSSAPGGGWGACIDHPAGAAGFPDLVGQSITGLDGNPTKVLRVERLFRKKGRKPGSRVILVVREADEQAAVRQERRAKEGRR